MTRPAALVAFPHVVAELVVGRLEPLHEPCHHQALPSGARHSLR